MFKWKKKKNEMAIKYIIGYCAQMTPFDELV